MARCIFWFTFIGTYAIFMPMHYLGMAGATRRYSQFTELATFADLMPLQKFITTQQSSLSQVIHFLIQSFLEH